MPRHHTVSYPEKWIAPVVVDGKIVEPGRQQAQYQEDIPFTEAEETARDAEEVISRNEQEERKVVEARRVVLDGKLHDDSITFDEVKELMRLSRPTA